MVKKKRWHCLPGQPVTELDKQVMFWENRREAEGRGQGTIEGAPDAESAPLRAFHRM